MPLIILSFIAGLFTIAAPCTLPLLPIIIGGSLSDPSGKSNKLRPLIICLTLAISVVLFGLLLKASTSLLGVPQQAWQWLSATILLLLGLSYLKPGLWESLSSKLNISTSSNKLLYKASQKEGYNGAILTGAALGPVFNSCSPTYALIVATIIPVNFFNGLIYLIAYALGLSLALLGVAFLGQRFKSLLKALSNPTGLAKKILGLIFILVGLAIGFGLDKKLQTYILENGWYDPISNLESKLK